MLMQTAPMMLVPCINDSCTDEAFSGELGWGPEFEDMFPGAVTMMYEPTDPYALTFCFEVQGEITEWLIGRELLDEAFRNGQAGIGDIKLAVTEQDLMIALSSPDGICFIYMPSFAAKSFLTMTYKQVQSGTEESLLDEDFHAEIAEFLGEGDE